MDVAQSVSRVGSQAQKPAYRAVAGDLKLAYSQFEELETFAKFGTHLDDATRKTIDHGQRIRACLKQPESQPVAVGEQIIVLIALQAGLFDQMPLDGNTPGQLLPLGGEFDPAYRVRIRLISNPDHRREGFVQGLPARWH